MIQCDVTESVILGGWYRGVTVRVWGRCSARPDTSCAHNTGDGKRRPTGRRCGDSELPEGSSREPELVF